MMTQYRTINDIIAAVTAGTLTIEQAVDAAVERRMEYALEYFSPQSAADLPYWKIRTAWKARSEAARPTMPAPAVTRATDTRPVLHCCRCGNIGHAGAYPFSTLPSSGRCDDCV